MRWMRVLFLFIVLQCIDGRRDAENVSNARLLRHVREANDDCDLNLTVSSSGGTLTSPNYPDMYPSNTDCRWLLTAADPNSSIFLRIDKLRIEPDTNCKLDYLQVYLGGTALAPSLGPFCGTINDRILKTNSSTLLVVFHSDPVYEDVGFLIDYFTQAPGGCQTKLTGGSGIVRSPGFPENYPDNVDCWTLITVKSNKKISLIFDTLDLEFGENCTFDFVQIFDGATRDSPLLGQVCRRANVSPIESSGNSLLLHFHSDNSVNRKGYRATYSAVDVESSPIGECLWDSDDSNGTIASPNYPLNYPSYSNCSIWITAPEGQWIFIVFDALQLEMESNCSYDYLQIRDGVPSNSSLVGTFCGKSSEPKNVTSVSNQVQIIFHSDDFAEFSGFKLRYWFEKNVTEAENHNERKSTNLKLSFDIVPESAVLKAGDSYVLKCSTKHPLAKIRWLHNDKFLAGSNPLPGLKLLSNNSMWIQRMDQHLAGLYTCAAVSDEEAIETTASIVLDSQAGSNDSDCAIVFRKQPRNASFAEGEFAHLECLAAGSHVRLSWEKDGRPLNRDKRFTLVRNGFLFLDSVTLDDAGVYTCVAYDEIAQCTKKTFAVLRVSKRANIEEICGKPKINQPSKDGLINQTDHGKIVSGHNAKKGAYPWQVMLWEPSLNSFCGGTLLNERWIATAAHCFKIYENLRWDRIVIKLGKFDREHKEPEEVTTGIADPSSIVLHPAYSKASFDNDLALVRLRDHVRFTDYILPICLGDRDLGESLLEGDGRQSGLRMGTVIGWGQLKERGPSPRYLQEIQLPIISQDVCMSSTNYTVSRNMFCAGYPQETYGDACHGDSGGPFQMSKDGRWYLVGIVSWGEGCGAANKYGFYTRIPNYLPWIKGIMKS